MNPDKTMEAITRPTVALLGEYDCRNLAIIERLLSVFCRVTVFTKNKDLWLKNTEHLNQANTLIFLPPDSPEIKSGFDYVLTSFLAENQISLDKFNQGLVCANINFSKIFFLTPISLIANDIVALERIRQQIKIQKINGAVVCVGDAMGQRIDVSENNGLSIALTDAISSGNKIRISKENEYFPVFLPELAKQIEKLLFSFGPGEASLAIFGDKISSKDLGKNIEEYFPNKSIVFIESEPKVVFPTEKNIKTKSSFREVMPATIDWLQKNWQPKKAAVLSNPRIPMVKIRREKKSYLKILLVSVFLLIFLSPLFFLGTSLAAAATGAKGLKNGRIVYSQRFLLASSYLGAMAQSELFLASKLPVVGRGIYQFYQLSGTTRKLSEIGLKTISLMTTTSKLFKAVLGDEIYDPSIYSQEIYLGLVNIYQETGFLQSETDSFQGIVAKVAKKATSKFDLSSFRQNILTSSEIAKSLPTLLGRDKRTTYLILLQNNMELRPTGGFIGSFVLMTFDGGRISDINVQDVYSADGQLKGHVEPPQPIKEHLGEANWFLRDSNWDADFPTSAARAEWFLSKEIGTSVDGVIALDLETVKSLLATTGPLKLSDYNQEISAANLYEVTQKQVEQEFFPGSYQKTNFLTALSRQILAEVTNRQKPNEFLLSSLMFENLQERHIQVFLHNNDAQKAISTLGYDGSFITPECGGNCYADWLGVVEANVGVNKANYFVKRSFNLDIVNDGINISRNLSINYQNPANSALGLGGRYKVYIRVIVPSDSEITGARIISGQDVSDVTPDISDIAGRREVGILLEVPAQQTKTVNITWNNPSTLNINSPGEYRLYWRKQAGTNEDPIAGKIDFTLTGQREYIYNTHLARDYFSRISW